MYKQQINTELFKKQGIYSKDNRILSDEDTKEDIYIPVLFFCPLKLLIASRKQVPSSDFKLIEVNRVFGGNNSKNKIDGLIVKKKGTLDYFAF